METRNFSAQQRRAMNIVWTGAGDYGFEPPFLAMTASGQPDFYLDLLVGLLHKWYGDEMPRRLFARWQGDVRQAMLDDLAWLGLESALYQRELPCRPALEALRLAHAEGFFSSEYQLSRQEWMEKNPLVYTLQSARWKTVLGQRPPVLPPWEKGFSEALSLSGDLEGDAVEQAILAAFQKYLQFDGTVRRKVPLRLHFDERWAPLLTKLMPVEIVRTDDLVLGRSSQAGQGGMVQAARALRAHLRSNEREEADRDYIEQCFGRCLFPPRDLALIQQRCCTGDHLDCRLWYTKGAPPPDKPQSKDSQLLAQQAAEQAKWNLAAFRKDSELYQSALARLTEQIRNCLLIHQQPQAIPARQGVLDGRRVWRAPLLGDDRIFLRSDPEPQPGFSVDLLLDGSASRLHCQEIIAAQGFLLAKSLAACGIPVRVSSFCSLRGYTVLRILKDFPDRNAERKIFDYFAAGWNRDGLALRGMAPLLRDAPAEKRLLLLLTDASPNDSHKIPPSDRVPLSRDYDGPAAVQDTAAQVRTLRQQGVRVAAIFMGESASFPDARTIYGRDLVRIRRMDELAGAAGKLIQQEIAELSD